MAKMMKKLMALVLVLALCASQVVLPVLAVTEEKPDGSIVDTVANDDGYLIVTTTYPDGTVSVTTTKTTITETEDAFVTVETGKTTTTETALNGESQGAVLKEDKADLTSTTTLVPEQSVTTEGKWAESGEPDVKWDEEPNNTTAEESGEKVSNGDASSEIVDVDHKLTEDEDDDVTLTFDTPNSDASANVTLDEELGPQEPTKELDKSETVEGNPVAGKTTEGDVTSAVVADPALDAEVEQGEHENKDGSTSVLVKNEDGTYTRTTTKVTTNTTGEGEKEALTQAEIEALKELYPETRSESVTSYVYLTENEKAGGDNGDGTTTTYSYSYVKDGDNILSITETTEVRDADGNLLSSSTETTNATKVTTTPITITDPTTKQVVTYTETTEETTEVITNTQYTRTDTTDLTRTDTTTNTYTVTEETIVAEDLVIDEEGNAYIVYNGKMYAVVDNGSNVTDEHPVAGIEGSAGDGKWDHTGTYMNGNSVTQESDDSDSHYWFGWWGSQQSVDEQTSTMMFTLKDGKEIRYVYCIELDQYTNENRSSYQAETFFQNNASADGDAYWGEHIYELRSVAVNGFWNTESGVGSLESVKSLLRLYQDKYGLSDTQIDKLSAKDALTATQVALWKYGSKDTNVFGDDFSKNKTIVALRDLLVELADEAATAAKDGNTNVTQELDAEAISGASLTLKEQVSEDTYNTDLTIKMSVSESSINGNLLITVKAGETLLGVYRLADDGTENQKIDGILKQAKDMLAKATDTVTGTQQVKANGDGTYTLENLVLPDGTAFTVNLVGTQHLEDGITIYMDDQYQDFIGLVSKDKEVDLSFQMEFSVPDPKLEKTTETFTQTGTTTQTYSGTQTQEMTKTDVQVTTSGTVTKEGNTTTTFYGDVTIVNEKVSETEYEYHNVEYKETEPEETEPEVTEPEETEPEETEPEETEPEETEPEATEPEATEPEATEPEATEPEATEPEATEPEATEPEATEPDDGNDPVPYDDDYGIPEAANFIWDDGMDNEDGEDIVILDEEVPLAAAPETGDISTLWAAASLFSLAGSTLLRKKKETDSE